MQLKEFLAGLVPLVRFHLMPINVLQKEIQLMKFVDPKVLLEALFTKLRLVCHYVCPTQRIQVLKEPNLRFVHDKLPMENSAVITRSI